MKKKAAAPASRILACMHRTDDPLTPTIIAEAKKTAGWVAARKIDNEGQVTQFQIGNRTYTARYYYAAPRDTKNPSNVVLLRGVSGVGKSIFALELAKAMKATVVSADHHFTNTNGEYEFVQAELPDAHEEAHRAFLACLASSKSAVVDNTNITPSELKFYVQQCISHRIGFTIIDITPDELKSITHSKMPQHTLSQKHRFLSQHPITGLMITRILNAAEPGPKK